MLEKRIDDLRKDIEGVREDMLERHAKNRADIHDFRNTLQGLQDRISPFFGTAEFPGMIKQMSADLQVIKDKMQNAALASAVKEGAELSRQTQRDEDLKASLRAQARWNKILSLLVGLGTLIGTWALLFRK